MLPPRLRKLICGKNGVIGVDDYIRIEQRNVLLYPHADASDHLVIGLHPSAISATVVTQHTGAATMRVCTCA